MKRPALVIPVFAVLAVLVFGLAASCAAGPVRDSRVRDGLLVENDRMAVLISDRLFVRPSLKTESGSISPVAACPGGRPTFHARLGGLYVTDFRVDWQGMRRSTVNDEMGPGVRYAIPSKVSQHADKLSGGISLDAELELTFYERFPTVITASFSITNTGERRLEINELVSSFYRLDRRLLDPNEKPWNFASYQGAATQWGEDYSLIWLSADFDRKNFMGLSELSSSENNGGGTPLVDVWAPECGLAVAHIETEQQWVSLPVRTGVDGAVEVSVLQEPDLRLGDTQFLDPGKTITSIRTAAILHELDFYDPIHTHADILRSRGVDIPLTSPEQAYVPYWKSWGLRFDFTQEEIFASLEDLRRVGIEWANLDDGWFTWYGDWDVNPSPGKFPGGEQDMADFVKHVHDEGFRTSLWWYPAGVSPESDFAKEHRDMLIMNEDGSLPTGSRGLYYLCPCYQPAIDFAVGQVRRYMKDWDYDGLYIDTNALSAVPPCFNPAHDHDTPLESFRKQPVFYKAIYEEAQKIKPGCPVEMCICAMPHDPYKMPWYNVANSSDPVNLEQVRRRIKVEKAYRGPTFCVGDCYQVPMDEWEGFSVPESFESAVGTGAQVTTFFTDLTPEQEKTWKHWIGKYHELGLAWSEYLNLYDIAFDKPEGHVVRKDGKMYYGFYANIWSVGAPIVLRGLEPGRSYRVYAYDRDEDLGTVSGDKPVIYKAFKDHLLLEVTPM